MQFLRSRLHNYGIRHREQSAYERTIAFKGRLTFKYFFQAKPPFFGINTWKEAIAQNGCVHEVQIYTGKHRGAEWVLE